MLEQELIKMLFAVDIPVPRHGTNFILYSIAMYKFMSTHKRLKQKKNTLRRFIWMLETFSPKYEREISSVKYSKIRSTGKVCS
jgi:hypothetical protein